jgi:BirA family transcriptional regulator, biotin operon repressor / biotin---[acetyl-CoA-carboxylase] ligase
MNYTTQIIEFESVDSTNKWSFENHNEFNKQTINIVTASHQTDGVGRGVNRKWQSNYGGIYMSVAIKLQSNIELFKSMNILSALTIRETLECFGIANVMIKWPNDIILNNKKIGGILTEINNYGDDQLLVVGIGLNNTNSDVIDIQRPLFPPSTICLETGRSVDKTSFINKFMDIFKNKFQNLLSYNNFSNLMNDFDNYNILKNKKIIFKDNEKIVTGNYHSLSPGGYLNLNVNGNIINFLSGDIISIE